MSGQPANPPAHGVRIEWSEVPPAVRADFEAWAGSPVISAVNQQGGFSPGVAARVLLADGRRVFVKAVSPAQNEVSPVFARREAFITRSLPPATPAPPLLWEYDQDGWVVLAFAEIAGQMPAQPWLLPELERVIDAMDQLADALTPTPLPPEFAGMISEHVAASIHGWGQLRDGPPEPLAALDDWSRWHLDQLIELEAQAPAAVTGSTLLHFDIRADNILLSPEQVWFVDWPHARVGAPWVDLAAFAQSAALNGGLPPEQILQRSRYGRAANPADVTAFLAALSGFFVQRSFQPAPPGLPTLRAFQAAQGAETINWLKQRLAV